VSTQRGNEDAQDEEGSWHLIVPLAFGDTLLLTPQTLRVTCLTVTWHAIPIFTLGQKVLPVRAWNSFLFLFILGIWHLLQLARLHYESHADDSDRTSKW
jgi:hypothetical protein